MEDWPKSKVPEGAIVDFKNINERFARVRFYQGEPILEAKLANEIEGRGDQDPGRAPRLQLESADGHGRVGSGESGRPGRHLRLLQGRARDSTDRHARDSENVRVFAVNDQTDQEIDQEGRTIAAKTVSVLVKQDQVAKLMLATELGTLRLALRRPNESLEDERQSGRDGHGGIALRHAFGDRPIERQQPKPINPLATATGGFVGFLNGLKSQYGRRRRPRCRGRSADRVQPAWQMTLLTPEGGTQFTWSDEHGLPEETRGAVGPATPRSADVGASRVSPRRSACSRRSTSAHRRLAARHARLDQNQIQHRRSRPGRGRRLRVRGRGSSRHRRVRKFLRAATR